VGKPSKGRGGKPAAPQKKTPWPLLIGAGALVLILAGALLLLRPARDGGATAAPAAAMVRDWRWIRKSWTSATWRSSSRDGDLPPDQRRRRPLQILGEPVVAVVSGC